MCCSCWAICSGVGGPWWKPLPCEYAATLPRRAVETATPSRVRFSQVLFMIFPSVGGDVATFVVAPRPHYAPSDAALAFNAVSPCFVLSRAADFQRWRHAAPILARRAEQIPWFGADFQTGN